MTADMPLRLLASMNWIVLPSFQSLTAYEPSANTLVHSP